MFSWIVWLIYQVVTTAAFFVWYAKKHPSEAKEMFMRWRNFFSKIYRSVGRFVNALHRAALTAAQFLASIYCSRMDRGQQ